MDFVRRTMTDFRPWVWDAAFFITVHHHDAAVLQKAAVDHII